MHATPLLHLLLFVDFSQALFVCLLWSWKSASSVETWSGGVEGFGRQAYNLSQDTGN